MANRKELQLTRHPDGAVVRFYNKKIILKKEKEKILIAFLFADEDAETPACSHKCHRGRVRETFLKLSSDAMEALIMAYIDLSRREKYEEELG